jgi:hypothetical protein
LWKHLVNAAPWAAFTKPKIDISFNFERSHSEINAIFVHPQLPSLQTSFETGGAARSVV